MKILFQLFVIVWLASANAHAQVANSSSKGDAKLSDQIKSLDDALRESTTKNQLEIQSLKNELKTLDLESREKLIEAKLKQLETQKDVVSYGQKSVDWWIAFLAFFIAIAGIGIPLLLTRNLRRDLERDLGEVRDMKTKISDIHSEVATKKTEFDRNLKIVAEAKPKEDGKMEGATAAEIQSAAKAVESSKEATFAEKLRARAVSLLSQNEYKKAAALFETLLTEVSDDPSVLLLYGYTLGELADAQENADEKLRLRKEAISLYERALTVKPDMHGALYSWGVALSRLAEAESNEGEKLRLRKEAISLYARALKVKPDKHGALFNWGVALSRLADAESNEAEKLRLRKEAISLYERALKVKPDMHDALYNLTSELVQLAHLKSENHDEILAQAEEVLNRLAASRGYRDYNDACLAAMRLDAKRFVELAIEVDARGELPDKTHIDKDRDLHGIRGAPEFVAWYEKNFGVSPTA